MKFSQFNLKDEIIACLNKNGYFEPTKVQEKTIPKALKGENLVVKSDTGSGKTHSFLIPIINNLENNDEIEAIILTPTKELANQTYNFCLEFKKYLKNFTVKLLTSNESNEENKKTIVNKTKIIIGTPKKIASLIENTNINYKNIKTIVFDEVDMLLENNFINDIETILSYLNKNIQIEVFSATITKSVEGFLKKYIGADYVITMNDANITSSNVKHFLINSKHRPINECVVNFIKIVNPYLLLIFLNSKEEVSALYNYLNSNGYKCGILSGELSSRERKSMLRRINNDEFRYIVCSDIAARGMDIKDVSDVLNIYLPNNLEYYYHRAGRTGRYDKKGNSYVLFDSDNEKNVFKLIEEGVNFSYLKFADSKLVEDIPLKKEKKKKKIIDPNLKKDIQIAKSKTKVNKVKPNYKKKREKAINKVKRIYKQKMIKEKIYKEKRNG